MPSSKYKPRSQRNRRRLGDARYNPAPNNGPKRSTIAVAGAGTTAVNGSYTSNGAGNAVWALSSTHLITFVNGLWMITNAAGSTVYYTNDAGFPPAANPPATGWIIGEGEGDAPAPTLTLSPN